MIQLPHSSTSIEIQKSIDFTYYLSYKLYSWHMKLSKLCFSKNAIDQSNHNIFLTLSQYSRNHIYSICYLLPSKNLSFVCAYFTDSYVAILLVTMHTYIICSQFLDINYLHQNILCQHGHVINLDENLYSK